MSNLWDVGIWDEAVWAVDEIVSVPWWNSSYYFRRAIHLPISGDFGDIPLNSPISVVINKSVYNAAFKLRSDFQDIEIIWYNTDFGLNFPVRIPYEIVDGYPDEDSILVNFELQTVGNSNVNKGIYYVYYGNTALITSSPHEQYIGETYINIITPAEYGPYLTFSNPGEDWSDGYSEKIGARAALYFSGINAKITVEKGPDKGILEIRIDNEDPFYIDTFNPVVIEEAVYTASYLQPKEGRVIRLRVTGDKAPSSSNFGIKLVSFEFSEFIEGLLGSEEIFTEGTITSAIVGI